MEEITVGAEHPAPAKGAEVSAQAATEKPVKSSSFLPSKNAVILLTIGAVSLLVIVSLLLGLLLGLRRNEDSSPFGSPRPKPPWITSPPSPSSKAPESPGVENPPVSNPILPTPSPPAGPSPPPLLAPPPPPPPKAPPLAPPPPIQYAAPGQKQLHACDRAFVNTAGFGFCNQSLSIDARIDDLLSSLRPEEKVLQLQCTGPEVPRLGIPYMEWYGEALHGVGGAVVRGIGPKFKGKVKCTTQFPQVINLGATFNASLWFEMAKIISVEARAMYNEGEAPLVYNSPNVNVFRDPRWGRGQETAGEDPFVLSEFAVQYVRGMQEGNDALGRLKTAVVCKHSTAYDMDNWKGAGRMQFNAITSKQDLEETFNPPFQACVQRGNVSGVMCAYNLVNGVYNCMDKAFLTDKLRKEWGFKGYVTSDASAVAAAHRKGFYDTLTDAIEAAYEAGVDLDCHRLFMRNRLGLLAALDNGQLPLSRIDEALRRLYTIRMRLGMFDGGLSAQPFAYLNKDSVATPEHSQAALDAAEQSIVLLVNRNDTLPLRRPPTDGASEGGGGGGGDRLRILVAGPLGNATESMLGNYYGVPCSYVSPLAALQGRAGGGVTFIPGCESTECGEAPGLAAAVAAARSHDVVVLVMGIDARQESEGKDRLSMLLPGKQSALVTQVAAAAKGPVVLVLMSGGGLDVSAHVADTRVDAIVWLGLPGQSGGAALTAILFGERSPAGRLPASWYPEQFMNYSMKLMRMRPNGTAFPGRTYKFYVGNPPLVFPFGHGLSYTRFAYSDFLAPTRVCASDKSTAIVQVNVTNVGAMDGDEVLLLFAVPPTPGLNGIHLKKLVTFHRIHLGVNETKVVQLGVQLGQKLTTVNTDGVTVAIPGDHTLTFWENQISRNITMDATC